MGLRDRLALLERRAAGGDVLVIVVQGGLPDELTTASAGGHSWTQEHGEDEADFKTRVVAAAREAGANCVVVGGLPA